MALFVGPLVVVVAIWELAIRVGRWPTFLLPSPLTVGRIFVEMLASGILFVHLWASLQRLLLGALVGCGLGVGLGFGIALWAPLRAFFSPIVTVLQPIPGIAWIPLAILWFGLGPAAVGFIIFLSAFFPVLFSTVTGVRTINRSLLNVARVMRCSRRMVLTDVVIPGALPFIITGTRIGLGYAWRALVAGEMIAATTGLGYLIFDARNYLKTEEVIVGMITIGLFWALIERVVLVRIERKTIERWGMAMPGA